jgi:hypothetical protein
MDWPRFGRELELAPVGERTISKLEANHKNKNIMDNDPQNLEWLCPSCHKIEDSKTSKGVSKFQDEFGYGLDLL